MRLALLLTALTLAACASEPEAPPTPAAPPADPPADTVAVPPPDSTATDPDTLTAADRDAPAAGAWTAGVVERANAPMPSATLRAVRTGQHEGFVRTVFVFGERVPSYHVEYVDTPVYHCGSGEVATVAGEGWLQVRFRIAAAHTEAGEATVTARDRRLDDALLRQLTLTCDFEGDVTWVLGMAAPNRFRTTELPDPPRLVLDVER